MSTMVRDRATTEDDITAEVIRRIEKTGDARLREIMLSLVRHLHAFVKEVQLNEKEWWQGIQFLTRAGHMCSEKRQEFILLSDTLGVSMVVDLISNRKREGATESTVFGPFHREGAPEMPLGANIAPQDPNGTPTIVSGCVLGLEGEPIPGAVLDVWQTDSSGKYDAQYPDLEEMHMRGKFRTDAEGRFWFRTTRPLQYPIPADGPVGEMLEATGRHPWRPAHIHFVVSADGYEPVTTHIFDSVDNYLDSDTVFGVKDSLITTFEKHETVDEDSKRFHIDPPFCTTYWEFVLQKPLVANGKR
jgi:hydroxyquinol 1,2-dioxygenase